MLSDFLGNELICEARRLQSSCQDALESQKKTFDNLSPFIEESSMLSGSENSVPLSVNITSNSLENSKSPNVGYMSLMSFLNPEKLH